MSRFCSRCGAPIEGGKFCPECGAPVVEKERENPHAAEEEQISQAATPSGEIILGPDGVYRWAYEFPLLTNPTILLLIWKIFAGIALGMYLFFVVLSMGERNFWFQGLLERTKVMGILLGILMALSAVGYLIYTMIMGGKYCVLFEMDERGVNHIQAPRQFDQAKVLALIMALTARNVGTMGSALLVGSKNSSSSTWSHVKSISCNPRTRVIKVNELLNKNQVYASKEDFAFVWNYILEHCPNAKIKGRIKGKL